MKRFMSLLLCGLLLFGVILTVNAQNKSYPTGEQATKEISYDEAKVLDQIADSWIETCTSNIVACEIGLGIYQIGKPLDDYKDQIRKDFLDNIRTGNIKTEGVQFQINVDELCENFLSQTDSNSLKSNMDIFLSTANSTDLDEQIANQLAESKICNTVKNGEIAPDIDLMDIIKENYSLFIGQVGCTAALDCFEQAKSTADHSLKREYMLNGALLATIGCGMSISDTDEIIKIVEDKTAEEVAEEIMIAIAETGLDLVEDIVPQFKIARDVITITADVGIKYLSMQSKINTLIEFEESETIAQADMSDYFDALSNQYGLYSFEIDNFEVIMKKYTGYLVCGDRYAKVVVPEDIYGFPVTSFSGCFAEELNITQITIPSSITSRSLASVVKDCNKLNTIYYNALACPGQYLGGFFENCENKDLKVVFGPGITMIPERFLINCGVSKVEFPDGIITMHPAALMECNNLTMVSIPSSIKLFETVTENHAAIFQNCINLQTVYYNPISAQGGYGAAILSNCGNNIEEMKIIIGEEVKSTPSTFIDNCGIKSIVFPDGMTQIREYAVSGCQKLEEITIPPTITEFESGNIFSDCDALKKVNYNAKSAKRRESLVSSDYVFYDIQSDFVINFGEGIEEIPNNFISNCGITNIAFPDGVKTIHSLCLVDCDSLQNVTVPESVETIGYDFVSECNNIDTIYFNAHNITSQNSSTIIENCGNIANPKMKVILGSNVATVPPHFIKNCGITEFVYPEGVTTINAYSLAECPSLQSVVIPSTVQTIDCKIISDCDNLSAIHYNAKRAERPIASSHYIFDNCGNTSDSKLKIMLGGSITSVPACFIRNCAITEFIYPEGVTEINENSLVNCPSLQYIAIPSSLQAVSDTIVKNCENLSVIDYSATNATWTKTTTAYLFYNCGNTSGLEVNLADNIEKLPNDFMYNCGVIVVEFPTSITEIPARAFYACVNLNEVFIPNSVTSIGRNAFNKAALTRIVIPNSVTTIGDSAFSNCQKLTEIIMPDSVTYVGYNAFDNCNIAKLVVAEGSQNVTKEMLVGEETLLEVVIPGSVSIIEKNAFDDCSNQISIEFKGDAPAMNEKAFYKITAVAYYPANNATWTEEVMQDYGGNITWIPYEVYEPGDLDGVEGVDNRDVEYLLWYTLFPEDYPLPQAADFDSDGCVDNKDVEYLLWHTLFPEDYPL